jgi:DNA recombination protein RmuC
LEKARKKISEADDELEKLVTTRTNVMLSKLRKVEELPTSDSKQLLGGQAESLEIEEDEVSKD